MVRVLAAVLLIAAAPAQADLYKWVDANGVTNYSSTPPAAQAKAAVIEDRVSVIPSDPSWREAAAMSAARPDYATEEWLQRQRLMALKETYTATAEYPDAYYPGYGYGYYAGYPVRRPRPAHPVARAGFVRASAAVMPRAAPRGALMR